MTAPRIPVDLSKRYRKLIHDLNQISKTIPSTGDPKLAKAGAAILSVLEFLQPPGSTADMSKLTVRPCESRRGLLRWAITFS